MASMAVSDSLLGAFIMPMFVLEVIHNGTWIIGRELCIFKYCVDYLLSAVSTLHILAMTLDRYLAVCHPLKYRLLTNKNAYIILTFTWFIPASFIVSWISIGLEHLRYCCNMYNFSPEFLTAFVCSFVVPFIILCILYFCILRKLAHYKISLQKRILGNSTQIFTQVNETDFSDFKESAPNRRTKMFRTIGAVMIGFTICWLPSWTLALIFLVRRYVLPNRFMVSIAWFAYLNYAISPVLYCCNRSVRKSVRSLLCPRSMIQ
ncbi:unnamed protein product [Lymnaea stagnalis]|uniref:G-protein coupled receptors family 1 profile domain-containing protein n=1 Tax=Lymnaea stagnalis TaxID=6523 RepID=A0AAV2HNC4_LYMST